MRLSRVYLAATLISACEKPQETPATNGATPPHGRAVRLHEAPDLPVAFCTDAPVEPATGEFSILIKQGEDDLDATENDVAMDDVAALQDGSFVVLDKTLPGVFHFNASGAVVSKWGRAGQGPGELSGTSSIAVIPSGEIAVAHLNGRIAIFKPDGSYQRTVTTTVKPLSDIAFLPDGRMVIVRSVNATHDDGTSPYAAIIDSTGAITRALLFYSATKDKGKRPFIHSARNLVRATAGRDGSFAVWFPTDQSIYLFPDSKSEARPISGCLDAKLEAFYKKQFPQYGSAMLARQVLGIHVTRDHVVIAAPGEVRANPRTNRLIAFSSNGKAVSAKEFVIPSPDGQFIEATFLGPDQFLGWGIQFSKNLTRWKVVKR